MFGTSNFDKLLDQSTNSNQLDIKWDSVLQLCDIIRQGDVQAKDAVRKITRKITSTNQHTAMYGLYVLDASVKNCAHIIQSEISTKEFMEQYKDVIEKCPHENVKTKALDMLQNWAYAFRNVSKYRPVNDTMNILKHEGYKFPIFRESEAMFSAEVAPGWKDSDRCHRCRAEFTLILRKHHCRACGEVLCHACSDKFMTLPQFGIEKEVRVCIRCHDKNRNNAMNSFKIGKESVKKEPNESSMHLSPQRTKRKTHKTCKSSPSWSRTMAKAGNGNKRDELPSEYLNSTLAQENQNPPPKKSAEELKEEEELQLALAISESEMETKRQSSYRATRTKSYSPPTTQKMNQNQYDNDDHELTRYLNRQYWANRATDSDRTAERELNRNTVTVNQSYDLVNEKSVQNGEKTDDEIDEFVTTLRSQVEIFVNRMKSNSSRGRSISNDTSVQTLFMNITAMHSKLLKYIQQQDDSRVYYEGLQDKLTQVKDARAALDALREEHRERLRREAEIAERQRHLQMAQKLEIMRQQKQEYLQYQRQLALQRIRDQEREMQLRQEQQKQQYRLVAGPYGPASYMVPSQGVISAFEPVTSIGMNLINVPPTSAAVSVYAPTPFPNQYPQSQFVNSVPPPQQQTVPQQFMISNQSRLRPSTSYVPGKSHPNRNEMVADSQNVSQGALGPGLQPSAQYQVNQPQSLIHPVGMNPAVQSIHLNQQNPHSMISPPQSTRVESSSHIIGPSAVPPSSSMMHHPNLVRPMMPPSTSPLSSPSSLSEHSIIQHGPQPMPSAPSANSTPQPEECKEGIAELISFD